MTIELPLPPTDNMALYIYIYIYIFFFVLCLFLFYLSGFCVCCVRGLSYCGVVGSVYDLLLVLYKIHDL